MTSCDMKRRALQFAGPWKEDAKRGGKGGGSSGKKALYAPSNGASALHAGQGLTLVHFSAQLKRFEWVRGYV